MAHKSIGDTYVLAVVVLLLAVCCLLSIIDVRELHTMLLTLF